MAAIDPMPGSVAALINGIKTIKDAAGASSGVLEIVLMMLTGRTSANKPAGPAEYCGALGDMMSAAAKSVGSIERVLYGKKWTMESNHKKEQALYRGVSAIEDIARDLGGATPKRKADVIHALMEVEEASGVKRQALIDLAKKVNKDVAFHLQAKETGRTAGQEVLEGMFAGGGTAPPAGARRRRRRPSGTFRHHAGGKTTVAMPAGKKKGAPRRRSGTSSTPRRRRRSGARKTATLLNAAAKDERARSRHGHYDAHGVKEMADVAAATAGVDINTIKAQFADVAKGGVKTAVGVAESNPLAAMALNTIPGGKAALHVMADKAVKATTGEDLGLASGTDKLKAGMLQAATGMA